jgi:hypothetical protein
VNSHWLWRLGRLGAAIAVFMAGAYRLETGVGGAVLASAGLIMLGFWLAAEVREGSDDDH